MSSTHVVRAGQHNPTAPGALSRQDCGTRGARIPWTPQEDATLEKLFFSMKERGTWEQIAAQLTSELPSSRRTAKQCRERWTSCLDPNISRQPWTPREKDILVEQYTIRPGRWAEIAKFLPGRTPNQVRWTALAMKPPAQRHVIAPASPKPAPMPTPTTESDSESVGQASVSSHWSVFLATPEPLFDVCDDQNVSPLPSDLNAYDEFWDEHKT